MRKLFVYPETRTSLNFSKYSKLLSEYCLVDSEDKSDCILLLEGFYSIESYIEIVLRSKKAEKTIFTDKKVKSILSDSSKEINYPLICLDDNNYCCDILSHLHNIDKPVIAVSSLGENTDKFAIQLSLREFFLSKNYSILQLGSSELSSFFGFDILPTFMFSEISVESKIKMLNSYIYKKLEEHDYDLIIIGVPGGILPYNNYICNNFGELAYVISRAMQIDVNILSVYLFDNITDIMLSKLDNYCAVALNTEKILFNISGSFICYNREERQANYFDLDNNYINENFPNSVSYTVFSERSGYLLGETMQSIEDTLATNVETI